MDWDWASGWFANLGSHVKGLFASKHRFEITTAALRSFVVIFGFV